jgi:hypothetical protein
MPTFDDLVSLSGGFSQPLQLLAVVLTYAVWLVRVFDEAVVDLAVFYLSVVIILAPFLGPVPCLFICSRRDVSS